MTTNCKALDIQSLFDGRKTVQEVSKMGFYGAQSHHVPKHKKLSKGNWCPVRQNMANGSAPIAENLCIPTACALQD